MAFVPEPEFPDLTQLITSLNNAQISVKNPALYQTIRGLIQKVQSLKDLAQEDIATINQQITDLSNTVNNITIGDINILATQASPLVVEDPPEIEPFFAIPGPPGRNGLDGKTVYLPHYCENEWSEAPPILKTPFQGVSGTFTTVDGKTVTVESGIITSIV